MPQSQFAFHEQSLEGLMIQQWQASLNKQIHCHISKLHSHLFSNYPMVTNYTSNRCLSHPEGDITVMSKTFNWCYTC